MVGIAKGAQVGRAEGEQVGIEKGLVEGEQVGTERIAINMIRSGMNSERIHALGAGFVCAMVAVGEVRRGIHRTRYPERSTPHVPPTKYLNRYLKILEGNFYAHGVAVDRETECVVVSSHEFSGRDQPSNAC